VRFRNCDHVSSGRLVGRKLEHSRVGKNGCRDAPEGRGDDLAEAVVTLHDTGTFRTGGSEANDSPLDSTIQFPQ
jgi:hypothetical protein